MHCNAGIHISIQRKQISEIKHIKSILVKIINKWYSYFRFMKCDRSQRKNKGNDMQQDGKTWFLVSKLVYGGK